MQVVSFDRYYHLGTLVSIQYIMGQLQNPLNSIIQFITTAQLAYISYIRIQEIRNIPKEEFSDPIPTELIRFNESISLNKVYFKYSVNDDYILKGISFTIPTGEFIALVGSSGSGKSTLIKLLMQLYAPASGEIFLGEQNISYISKEDWRSQCGVITQESCILKDSIINNIVFGRIFDQERFIRAVQIANIQKEIEHLPKGYNTYLGENGRGLSEGQKQRILFARAVYNEPKFLFLDELTSSLDSNNEFEIIKSLMDNLKGCTIVMAAHRLSSIMLASKIIVLEEGALKEIGTHKKLMEAKGLYYKLFNSQVIRNIEND